MDSHYPSLRRAPSIGRTLAEAVLGGKTAARLGWGEVVTDSDAYRASTRADWATGAAWLLGRRCWDEVGMWDESYFLYSEEVEYALRAATGGWDLRLAPRASAVHLGGDRLTNPALYSLMIVNRYRLFRSLRGRLTSGTYLLALALFEAVRSASAIHRAALRALFEHARGRTHQLLANRE
jgi:GT2 family glycosyltransferase